MARSNGWRMVANIGVRRETEASYFGGMCQVLHHGAPLHHRCRHAANMPESMEPQGTPVVPCHKRRRCDFAQDSMEVPPVRGMCTYRVRASHPAGRALRSVNLRSVNIAGMSNAAAPRASDSPLTLQPRSGLRAMSDGVTAEITSSHGMACAAMSTGMRTHCSQLIPLYI